MTPLKCENEATFCRVPVSAPESGGKKSIWKQVQASPSVQHMEKSLFFRAEGRGLLGYLNLGCRWKQEGIDKGISMGTVVQAAPSLWLHESYFSGLVFRQMESLRDLSQGCLSSGDMGQPRNVAVAEWGAQECAGSATGSWCRTAVLAHPWPQESQPAVPEDSSCHRFTQDS